MISARRYFLLAFASALFLGGLLFHRQLLAGWVFDTEPPTLTITCGGTELACTKAGTTYSCGQCADTKALVTCIDPLSGCQEYQYDSDTGGTSGTKPFGSSCTPGEICDDTIFNIDKDIGTISIHDIIDWSGNISEDNYEFTFADCDIDITAVTVEEGATQTATAVITSGSVDQVDFSITDESPAGTASVNPVSDLTSPYETGVTGDKVGTANLNVSGIVGGTEMCSDVAGVTVTAAGAWWQVKDADVGVAGGLVSSIPAGCSDPCDPKFNLVGEGGYPGVSIHSGGTTGFGEGSGGVVADPAWIADSAYNGPTYDYDFFARAVPSAVFTDPSSVITSGQINGGDLQSGYSSGGYTWWYRDGDLIINGAAVLGDADVIILVTGNLTINNKITITDGKGFFAAIVKGNINIDDGVTYTGSPAPDSSAGPELEGLYMADGTISTGTDGDDKQLYVRGSLVGWGGINLERDLGNDNDTTPAEFFEYAPDLVLTLPRELLRQGVVWKEVVP